MKMGRSAGNRLLMGLAHTLSSLIQVTGFLLRRYGISPIILFLYFKNAPQNGQKIGNGRVTPSDIAFVAFWLAKLS